MSMLDTTGHLPMPRFEVIVPIHNSAHMVRLCLAALERTSPPDEVHVTCVLDACDSHTTRLVRDWCAFRPNSHAIELPFNLGFVGACNAGIVAAKGEFIVLVNSDTCATAGWCEAFTACFSSDPSIGMASPLSNRCPHNSVPIQPGLTLTEMAALVACRDPVYPDITTCEGFFLAMRRVILDDIGFFDEIFGKGYCEESDLSLRANYFGFRTVLVDNCYIFHYGRETFGTEARQEQYDKNKKIFYARWGKRYGADIEAMRSRGAIDEIRRSLMGPKDLPSVLWVEK